MIKDFEKKVAKVFVRLKKSFTFAPANRERLVRIVQREHNIKFKVFTTESLILAQDER